MAENRIAFFRRASGMNQRELGEQLGVAQTTVSAWERGINEPDNESMHKMSKMFETTIGYLAGFEQELPSKQNERNKRIAEQIESQRTNREIEKYLRAEALEKDGLSDDDIADIEESLIYEAWENGTNLDTFEGYCAGYYIDTMDKSKRETVLKMVKAAAKK